MSEFLLGIPQRWLSRGLVGFILLFWGLASTYPLIWMIFASLKTQGEVFRNIWLWPANPVLENYARAWVEIGIGRATMNSFIVTMGSVLGVLMVASIGGYALARIPFRGRDALFALILLTIMIRPVYTSIEVFRLTMSLGIMDTYLGLILPYIATNVPLALALFAAYFRSIPKELEEAARCDGANGIIIFLRIVLPLSWPVIAAVSIFTFMDAWNELFMALVLLKDPGLRTLPPLIAGLTGQLFTHYPMLIAALAASAFPVIAFFLVMQKRFMRAMAGAVGGM